MEWIQMTDMTTRILLTRSICEVHKNVPLRILVTNVFKKPVVLHLHVCIAFGTGPSECRLGPGGDEESKATANVTMCTTRRWKIGRRKLSVTIRLRTKVQNKRGKDGELNYARRQVSPMRWKKLMHMLPRLEFIWDGHLYAIGAASYRIQSIPSDTLHSIEQGQKNRRLGSHESIRG